MKTGYLKTTLAAIALNISALIPAVSYANVWDAILDQLEQQTGIQQTIQQYTQNMANDLTSQNVWANFNYDPNLQSWGNNAHDWNSVLNLYQQGGAGVGGIASQLNKQFPIQSPNVIDPNNPNSTQAQYYQLQAQTALASRAASQFDYNNLQNQIDNLQKLHDQIDITKDLKSSADLANRFQYESTMLQIELLRLLSLSNQQQAVAAQNQTNAMIDNANFSN